MSYKKYKPYPVMDFSNRTWPGKKIEKAPMWCSVDLRDGNQALPVPMSVEKKVEMFKLLKNVGFKEIEVGFPSASDTEYAFLRKLVDDNLVDDDITVQVLTQAREHLIRKTFESLKGLKKAVVHFYNSTSVQQRKVVFGKSKKEIIEIAVNGAKLIKELEKEYPDTKFIYQYSPESFTGTEMDFALNICEAVIDVIKPTKEDKLITNLPATVEMSRPNTYADQIEWFLNKVSCRESIILSLHAHNDRGTAVAATELALMAGADRVEGTLFGNGERTGNVDILTLGMNMYSQGIDPELDFSDMDNIVSVYEKTTLLEVPQRHPYAGELVYTAFSGSHQDAIRKGLKVYKEESPEYWEVPYLPIDPMDLGREYEPIIRINSQSGKGGIAFVLEQVYDIKMPKTMHPEVGKVVQKVTDESGRELISKEIYDVFIDEFVNIEKPLKLNKYSLNQQVDSDGETEVEINAEVTVNGEVTKIVGLGNGPISAFFHGISKLGFDEYSLIAYNEHALTKGENAKAIAYIQLENSKGELKYGAGIDSNIDTASLKAIVSCVNRMSK